MTIPRWNTKAGRNEWDTVTLDEWELPGVWDVIGSVGQKLDIQQAKGTKGAKIANNGPEGATLTLKGRLTFEEADEFEQGIDQIHPRNASEYSGPKALANPKSAMLGITQVRVKSITLPRLVDGLLFIDIEVLEYFDELKAAKQKPKKPNPSKPAGDYDSVGMRRSPWAPTGVDVLDSQWPAAPKNVQGVHPFGA